jgi:hypothetical protein
VRLESTAVNGFPYARADVPRRGEKVGDGDLE